MNEKVYNVNRELNDYKPFFDHAWAVQMFDEANGTALESSVFNLCESWKGAANTASLPWITVEMVASFADAFCNHQKPYMGHLLDLLKLKLFASVEAPVRPAARKAIMKQIDAINSDYSNDLKCNPSSFNRHEFWARIVDEPEFGFSLISSQRLGYAAIYFAYEDFIVSCLRKLDPSFDRIDRSFPNKLASKYGQPFVDKVWSAHEVKLARLVRHAVAHNGSRQTTELATMIHSLQIIEGTIQINAQSTRNLFKELAPRAMAVLRETHGLIGSVGLVA